MTLQPKKPQLSVITPVFNRVQTVSYVFDSLARQSCSGIQHIIVDGQSTDGTIERVTALAGPDCLIISEQDEGIYDALNKGIEAASGEIIGVLHSDDRYFDNTVLGRVIAAFNNPDVDMVYGDGIFFSSANPEKTVRYYHSGSFSMSRIARGFQPNHVACFFRRRVYEKFGLYDKSYKIAGDFEFFARLSKDAGLKSHYIQQPLVRMQTGGLSNSTFKNRLLQNREILRACQNNRIYSNYPLILTRYLSKIMELIKA